jgi:RHS repeat-associated protein
VSSVAYANGRAQPAKLVTRYEYAADSSEPVLIARPSVVAGREHQVRISYNAEGQPLSVTETGFSPLDDRGQANATAISRTTTYTYRTINGRSLLAAIDGPLANGKTNSPADSDVTRMEWDRKGSAVVVMTTPGGFSNTVKHDKVGRIIQVSNADGFSTRFTYDARNQVTHVSSSGAGWAQAGIKPVVNSYRHDALGRQVESGSGEINRPQTLQAFDVAGRLLWQAEALGILKRASYDTEGHLLSSTVQTKRFEQTERYSYDDRNRLIRVTDNSGVVRNVVYAKNRPTPPRAGSSFRILKDDFGREVMVASASHGTLTKRYDTADRLIEQRSDKGDAQTYAYNLTGQRIRHSVIPKAGETQTTTWRYARGRLVEVIDPVQSERIRYNERGQPDSKTVTLKLANGAEAIHVTRYTYTADGSLQSESLPDGTKINYERNGQGQVVAVSRQTSPWTFFGWGKTTLVQDLERDLIGLRHVTYGNGIQGQWQRSREGVLARVVYTRPPGQAIQPSRVAAASKAAARQTTLGNILGDLLPAAHAQTPPSTPSKLPGALGIPANPQALFDARLLYDDAGNVLLQKQQGQSLQHTQAYAYDRQSQLIAAQSASPSPTIKTTTASDARVWRYHYDRNGNRDLAQENVPVAELGHTRKAVYDPASNAMTAPAPDREYVWDAQGQLIAIRQENRELAHYRYNHLGLRVGKQVGSESAHTLYNDQRQRIADLDAQGKITRQYIWLGIHLIATLDARQPKTPQAPGDGFFAELTQTALALWNGITGNTDRLAFVHVNHLGAPIAATDETGHTLWQADYAPYGKVIRIAATGWDKRAYALALRLPGQWEDAESGLYYNDARYYDPQSGRYLSPDPLGRLAERLGSPNAYAYVNNNPASYIDPWGLILFAFDGTGNTPDSRTNVYWLSRAYDDNDTTTHPDGSPAITGADKPFYIEGPGTSGVQWLDGAVAYTLKGKINSQLDSLDKYVKAKWDDEINVQKNTYSLDNPLIITLDIVGFSRGAAAARDFANQVIDRKNSNYYNKELFGFSQNDPHYNCVGIKIRFMGLFETVLSTAVGDFNLGISNSQIEYVSQAVAVNEHRALFPLESIEDSYGGAGFTPNRVEKGFIGAHSDIGGGYAGLDGDGGDLSDVALNWMYAQAKLAGVNMEPLEPDQLTVTSPILHDETNVLPWYLPGFGGLSSDRDVKFPDQTLKGKDVQFDGMTYQQSQQNGYINYYNNITGNQAGAVDMDKYKAWLQSNLNLTLQ